jgi:hypothetical protein
MRLAVQACQLRMNSSYRPYWHTLMRIPGTHQPWGGRQGCGGPPVPLESRMCPGYGWVRKWITGHHAT